MNKKEFQQKIKDMKPPMFFTATTRGSSYEAGFEEAKLHALLDSNFLNEPEKPVVPQFVADWYEANKEDFEYSVQCLCVHCPDQVRQIDNWFDDDGNKPIETLVMMHKFGYEVDKEKLYRVELPNPNGDSNKYGLCKVDGRVIIGSFVFGLDKAVNTKLTEAEIKQDFEWAFRWAREVSELEDGYLKSGGVKP